MKKLTINLTQYGPDQNWDMKHGKTDIGELCLNRTRELLDVQSGHRYKLRIRQTKTLNKTTTVILDPEKRIGFIWRYTPANGMETPHANVFLGTETDRFLTQAFGTTADEIYLRITVECLERGYGK